jgi:hypothetical protein
MKLVFGRKNEGNRGSEYCSVLNRCYAMTASWADVPGTFLDNGLVHTSPLLGSRFLIIQQLDYNSGRPVSSTWYVPICYKQGTRSFDSSVRESVKKGLEAEAEE